MKKFVVKINGEETIAAMDAANQTLMFLVTYRRWGEEDMCTILLHGADLDKHVDYKWMEAKIEGDEAILLEVQSNNDDQISDPKTTTRFDKERLNKSKVQHYLKLKKEGLI